MKRYYSILLTAFFVAASFSGAHAQYSNEGVDPFSTRWLQFQNHRYRIIFPEQNDLDAKRVSLVLDTAYTSLHYGLSRPAKRLPIVLHTRNLRSNGVVTWTPKRAELVTSPPTESFATPWLKQLTLHEYRHVVQMSNLDRYWFRWLSYPLGEQAGGAAAIFVPKWYLEGDAVFAETALSAYGRALQPEFTITYRALLAEHDVRLFPVDKWFCGSYKDYMPNHYYLGYQLVNASYNLYGPDFWETIIEHVTKHPYQVIPRPIAFRKYYNTSVGKLFRGTFRDMRKQWENLLDVEENMTFFSTPVRSYTVYSHPVPSAENQVIAHKYDFVDRDRLVSVDTRSGKERRLTYTGLMSSRPVLVGEELLWTEYQASTFWEQKNRSVLRRMPADGSSRATTVGYPGNLFYVTEYQAGFAAIDYDPAEKYALVLFDPELQPESVLPLPQEMTFHGMAWDEKTNTLALIALEENGMSLMQFWPGTGSLSRLTAPSFVAINHLSAADGKLFYNSIASGKDEAHYFDLAEQQEYRITSSRFGTVMPSFNPRTGELVQASYRREGYLLSGLKLAETQAEPVEWTSLPVNLVNPKMFDFRLSQIDGELFLDRDQEPLPSKKYRKGTHLFHVHSWAPVSFNVFDAANSNDRNLDLNLGVTVMSQSVLNNTEAYLTYGYVNSQSWWRGGLKFLALAPKFEINAEYGGGYRRFSLPSEPVPIPDGWADKKYFSVGGTAYLPIGLSSGATARSLTPSVSLRHYNLALWQPDKRNFISGYERLEYSLAYAQNTRLAYRDLAPRWGFGMRASYSDAPFNDNFGSLWSVYGNVYVPGILANHSLRLRGVLQGQNKKYNHFGSNVLFPRGVDYNFAPEELWAATAEYRFPMAYPDAGIDQFLYVKRISLNVFGGYSRYKPIFYSDINYWENAWSLGGEFSFDFAPLRMVGNDVNLKAALYKASDKDGLSVNFSLTVDI